MLAWFPSDRDILVALYNATNGPFWSHNDNWLTDAPLDSWAAVETDVNGRVVSLDFSRLLVGSLSSSPNQMYGSLPVELAYLSELRELNLMRNQLTGPIPPELGRLSNLRSLNLYDNHFTGGIPEQLGHLTSLEELNLRRNSLTGAIPSEFDRLSNLRVVDLSRNELSGPIPPFFADFAELRSLRLRDNRLSGEIPPALGSLTNLEVLDLSQNPDLTGEIPIELGNLWSLIELDLTSFGCCPQFTGSIPRELANLTQLRHLLLGYNRLAGSIPPELGNLANLERLELHFSELSGPIPPSLGNLENLKLLYLPRNDLSGTIPPELGRLSRLTRLLLWGNSLRGAVPRELGDLADLTWLLLDDNQLTGPLPPDLANLGRLYFLGVRNNAFSGPIPQEFINLPLRQFRWQDSGLCAPVDREFQVWLDNIPEQTGGSACLADALSLLYDAADGPTWTNAANWGTDEPVSKWYGVTANDDGRVTGLDLRANGLSGALPPEIGFLADLRRLDLRDNRLAGEVPAELADLAELRQLYLSGNRFEGRLPSELGDLSQLTVLHVAHNQFAGALPSSLSGLSQLADLQWNDSGLCAPLAPWYEAWLETIETHTGGASCSPVVRLSVNGAHVNQAAQDLAGSVPLIAGRDGLLRVLMAADQANDYQPRGEAMFFQNGYEVHRAQLELRSDLGIPEDATSAHPEQSLLAEIPGEVLAPGVEVVAVVDPDSLVPRAAGSEVRFPAQGRLALDVLEMPRMELTVVPVLAAADPDSSVLDWVSDLGAQHPTIEYVTHVLPVGEFDVSVREPFVRAQAPLDSESWVYFLDEMRLLRVMDGERGYYFGLISSREGTIAGVGVRWVAVGKLRGEIDFIMAHELGHAMRIILHSPCGVMRADPDYPYPGGSIGVWGYDARSSHLVPPSTPDVMGYCRPAWISDYTFNNALRERLWLENDPATHAADDNVGPDERLLLWGGVSAEGELRLNPAFALDMSAQLPARTGPYRLEGFGTGGIREFLLDFDMDEVSEGGGSFLFAIPFEEHWPGALERIVLTGSEGTVELSGDNHQAMALVLDRETGRLRSVLRDDDAVGAVTAAAAETSGRGTSATDTRVLLSYGLPNRVPN